MFLEKRFRFELQTLITIIDIVMSDAKFVISEINFYMKLYSHILT